MLLQNQAKSSFRLANRKAYSLVIILHSIAVLVFVSAITTSALAQSVRTDGSKSQTGVPSETAVAVLQNAEKTGSQVEATIEITTPLTASALDYVSLAGQIQSILVTSATSQWRGGIYSTPNSPITSLSEGLRMYESLYRKAGPADRNAIFVITAFTIRGSASEISRAEDSLPSATLISAAPISDLTRIQNPKATNASIGASINALQSSESKSIIAAAASGPAFVPSKAQLTIQTLPNSDRRIEVIFSWNNPQDLAGLSGDKAALEIQVLLWNQATDPKKNNVSYAGALKSWGSEAIGHAYFDTQALNNSGIAGSPYEREITIGSYEARSDFQVGREYKVWAITERGALDANFAKLSFQRGIYKPNIFQNLAIYNYCQQYGGGTDPASCVGGEDTVKVTPVNYTGSNFSILAPTVPSFAHPDPTCLIPPGYPDLGNGRPSSLTEQIARDLVSRILPFQKAFTANSGRSGVGCPTNFAHQDTAWWPNGGRIQDFDGNQGRGALMLAPNSNEAFWVHGAIWTRYSSPQFGGPRSVLGEPTGNEQPATSARGSKGAYHGFTRGWLYFNSSSNRTFYVINAIAQKYKSVGLHLDQLGFPTSDEYAANGGARNDFEGGYIQWTPSGGAVIVRYLAPTFGSYLWTTTPKGNQPFSGTISGTNFLSGNTQVFFCANGSTLCYQHPPSLVTVNSSTKLSVSNVNLGSGLWQLYVKTSAGQSVKSPAFTVQALPPTVKGVNWAITPRANVYLSGTATGTNFVAGETELFFCLTDSNTCYRHPTTGVKVESPTSLTISKVMLDGGAWQMYVKTPAGSSARSSSFAVLLPPPSISQYSWNATPRANQTFSGTIRGETFIAGGTQVFFCKKGTNTCYLHPGGGVNVTSLSKITVANVKLGVGSWEIYLQTAFGKSARSSAFSVT